jgi:hypothetical protein
MTEFGYITLSQAETLSGIKADTLKKRCQEGKIKGAMKQGKTWFIPKNEVIKDNNTQKDRPLHSLAALAEAGLNINVTLFSNGIILNGNLISSKDYYERMRLKLEQKLSSFTGNNIGMDDKFTGLLDLMFDEKVILTEKETGKEVKSIHLDNVKMLRGESFQNLGQNIVNIKLSSINGFYFS